MRRISISIAVLLTCTNPTFSQADFTRGDANSECALDISDALYTLSWLFLGGPPPLCEDAADANDSGVIDIGDVVYGLNYLFVGGPMPPAPFPTSGQDPTDDALRCNLSRYALSFDGEDDFVSIPSSQSMRFGAEMSVSAWIYLRDERTRHHVFTKQNHIDELVLFEVKRASSVAGAHVKLYVSPMPAEGLVGTRVIPIEQWVHLAFTVSPTEARIYVNGELDGTMSMVDWPMITGGGWVRLGGIDTDAPDPINGMIAGVAAHNRTLSQDEIRARMHRRLCCDEPGLVGYYPCDEGSGPTLRDASCAGNDGQLGHFAESDSADPAWVPGREMSGDR